MTQLEFLQEVYSDWCDKHGLEHVSTCEQSCSTPEQWQWLQSFNELWDHAQSQSDSTTVYGRPFIPNFDD
jgi:hypothetical protein